MSYNTSYKIKAIALGWLLAAGALVIYWIVGMTHSENVAIMAAICSDVGMMYMYAMHYYHREQREMKRFLKWFAAEKIKKYKATLEENYILVRKYPKWYEGHNLLWREMHENKDMTDENAGPVRKITGVLSAEFENASENIKKEILG